MVKRSSLRFRGPEAGIALISALLILILLSALGVALLYKVTYEQHLQKADSSNNVAYYGAEAAMEKMMADLDNLYAAEASPGWCDIEKLQTTPPNISDVNVTYPEYTITVPDAPTDCSTPPSVSQPITQGPNAGLYAEMVPLTLMVTADHASGNTSPEEVRMVRQVEIAEIPVFQFGVYSTNSLSFFSGPDFDFNGRVQTNSNLFIASKGTLTFHLPIRAAGDVVRDQLSNQLPTAANGYTGTTLIPTTASGCDGGKPACRSLAITEGSSAGGPSATYGIPAGTGTENTGWSTISNTDYNGIILSNSTGAKPLNMSFVQAGVGPIEILRRPAGEAPDSPLGESRLYNQAQIRVLLSDDPAELPGGAADGQNIRLYNGKTNASSPDYTNGVPVLLPTGVKGNVYFAEGYTPSCPKGVGTSNTSECYWTAPQAESTLKPTGAPLLTPPTTWNLLDGYIRVEYRDSTGTYIPVTQEWLELGFARGFYPPTASSPNTVNPNAILILQEKADRNFNGSEDPANPTAKPPILAELPTDATTGTNYTGPATRNNWYPINMYDVREGELREQTTPNTITTCRAGGVMNLIEIDVNNLRKWLSGTIGKSGTNVEYISQNGYILYVSDRRGMILNPNLSPPAKNGEYGFDDVINTGTSGAPNGKLDAGEDIARPGTVDVWGAPTVGLGFGAGFSGAPFTQVSCLTPTTSPAMPAARPNWISGARHAVRLVDGAVGALPSRPDGKGGGFTLGSENPAYVLGDYNATSAAGAGFSDPPGLTHVPGAVIADTVTLLSNNWTDLESFKSPDDSGKRIAGETYFRLAIALGTNQSFKRPVYTGVPPDYGTDGGVHNFLRFLESWSGVNAHYLGSMASMYYSEYSTGIFKCCGTVYQPPNRQYAFDTDFLDLNKLPPGTPRFRDVEAVGFQQVF